jgi:hypothetical protein
MDKRSLLALARELHALGLATQWWNVDAGARLRVALAAADSKSGAPVAGANVAVDGKLVTVMGATDGAGKLDETRVVVWSATMTSVAVPPPPPMRVMLRKVGYLEVSIAFDLRALQRLAGTAQLDLGKLGMTPL